MSEIEESLPIKEIRDHAKNLEAQLKEAQAQAQAFGALPGFGKAALADPALADRFAMILGR